MTDKNQHIPQGYKDSPLGIIPEDWEVKRLGEIGEVLMCKRIMKYQTNSCGDIPFFKIGTFGGTPDAYISRELYDEFKAKYSYPKVGDVLISAAGTIGRSVIFDGTPSYYQDSNIVWIDNDNKQLLNKYLYYYYSTINWITDTGTIPRLYNGALRAIQIPTPPIAQQKRIVSFLELWDTTISKQTALIEKLILRKRGLMQQLLTGKKRLKGFEGKCKEVRLGECGKFLSNNTLSREQLNESGGIVQNIHYGDVLIKYPSIIDCSKATLPFINEFAYKESMTDFVKNGDIVIADTAEDETVGKACEVQNIGTKKILAGLHTMLFRPNEGLFSPFFLGYYINSEVYHSNLIPLIQGIKVCSIGKQAIQNTTITIPSINEQTAIASVLVNSDKEIELAKQKLSSLQEQKKGLMQVLLTGKKRIK